MGNVQCPLDILLTYLTVRGGKEALYSKILSIYRGSSGIQHRRKRKLRRARKKVSRLEMVLDVFETEIVSFNRKRGRKEVSNLDAENCVSLERMKSFPLSERMKSFPFREREKLETARLPSGGTGVGENDLLLLANCELKSLTKLL